MSTTEVFFFGSTVADRPSFGIGVDYEVVEEDSKCPLTAIFPLQVHQKKTEIVFRRRQTETRSAGVSASAELFVIHVMCDAIFDDVE